MKPFFTLFTAIALLAAVITPVPAQPATAPEAVGSVTGQVIDARTGEPVTAFQVWRMHETRPGHFVSQMGHFVSSPEGRFQIDDLPADHPLKLGIQAEGHSFAESETFQVESGGTAGPINVSLGQPATIRGRVADARTRDALKGISVHAQPAEKDRTYHPNHVNTDEEGRFEHSLPITGEYILQFASSKRSTHVRRYLVVDVQSDMDIGTVYLEQGGSLQGRVTRHDGVPIPSRVVITNSVPFSPWIARHSSGQPSEDGTYNIHGAPFGTYNLIVYGQGDYVGLRHLETVTIKRPGTKLHDVVIPPTYKLTGSVQVDGEPPENGVVYFIPEGGINPKVGHPAPSDWGGTVQGPISDDGTYTAHFFEPGTYNIEVNLYPKGIFNDEEVTVLEAGTLEIPPAPGEKTHNIQVTR